MAVVQRGAESFGGHGLIVPATYTKGTVQQWVGVPDAEVKTMPQGDKSKYTDKQKRQAEHIEESYKEEGASDKKAERIAWATVNKQDGGGKRGGSGTKSKSKSSSSTRSRGESKSRNRSEAAKKGWETRRKREGRS